MKNDKSIIISSLIVSMALIVCAYMMKDTNLFQSSQQTSIPYINADFTGIQEAIKSGNDNKKDILSLNEAAEYLGVKPGELTLMANNGVGKDLPFVNFNGTIIFSRKALDEWIYVNAKENAFIKP